MEEKMKKKINASLKLKIAIEAFKGDMTIGELAGRYEVSPAQIHRWKRQLLDHGAELLKALINPPIRLMKMKSKSCMPTLGG